MSLTGKHIIRGTSLIFLLFFFAACSDTKQLPRPYADLDYSYYDTLRNANYAISAEKIGWYIDSMRIAARDTAYADIYVNRYYARKKPYLWIDLAGADSKIDSLAEILATIDSEGVKPTTVFQPAVSKALRKLRMLDFKKPGEISRCLAEMEYFSTKGLVRMASGMRYGFINPYKFHNRLDTIESDDTVNVRFHTLYDIPTETADKKFLSEVIASIPNGEFPELMSNSRCASPNYLRLRREYSRKDIGTAKRNIIAVNMERYRWRTDRDAKKFVWINLPEFHLRAIDDENGESLSMKVCEGSIRRKTPMLTSAIERIELNPVWTVPQSIISREIAPRHAGDPEYFERNRMKIIDKTSGDEVMPEDVDAEMLRSGNYSVVQNKGEGNALGKMIFRFKNNFSIFLHDTPNRDAFNRTVRAVSHGCVRLEKPFDLAVFLLNDKDPLVIDKMRIAIGMPPETDEGKALAADESHKTMGLKRVKPPVPLYITYFTAYPGNDGRIVYTADPYKYDGKMLALLQTY